MQQAKDYNRDSNVIDEDLQWAGDSGKPVLVVIIWISLYCCDSENTVRINGFFAL